MEFKYKQVRAVEVIARASNLSGATPRGATGSFFVSNLNCCGKVIKPYRQKVFTDEGIKIFKSGKCNNKDCRCFNLIIETVDLFGRAKENYFRGKKALREIEKHKAFLIEHQQYRRYKKNTAKGIHYACPGFNKKENKFIQEIRELSTDRKIGYFESKLKIVTL